MLNKCNCYDCLRKFKADKNDTISDFCGIYGYEKEIKLIHNSKECPFYCDKFYCYELNKIITKHENVHWISDDKNDSWDKFSNGLSIGLFVGLSREGSEKQEKRETWENKHEDCDTVICPYCDFEFESWDSDIPHEDSEEEIECPKCDKTFNCTCSVSYSYSTSKLEEFEEDEE